MANSIGPKLKGRTAKPAFYESSKPVLVDANSNKDALGLVKSGWPIVIGVVTLGVGILWFLVQNDRKVYTTPILTLTTPAFGQGAQASTVANLTASVQRTVALIEARYPEE